MSNLTYVDFGRRSGGRSALRNDPSCGRFTKTIVPRPVSVLATLHTLLLRKTQAAFPGSTTFAEYLAERVKYHNGSVFVLGLIIERLKSIFPDPDPVGHYTVIRHSVDGDEAQTRCLYEELPRHGVNTAGSCVALSVKLRRKIDMKGKGTIVDCTVALHDDVDLDRVDDYVAIFVCALAMLKGLTIEPRDMVENLETCLN